MGFEYFRYNLNQLSKLYAQSDEQQKTWENRIADMRLTEEEEKLLCRLWPPDVENFGLAIADYRNWISIMRGESRPDKVWMSEEYIRTMKMETEDLEDLDFFYSFIQSLYWWYLKPSLYPLAIAMLKRFERYTRGNFLFAELSEPWVTFYRRTAVTMLGRFFSSLPDDYKNFIYLDLFLVYLIRFGFDIDQLTKDWVLSYVSLENRQKISLMIATAITSNKSRPVSDKSGRRLMVGELVEKYKEFSKDKSGEEVVDDFIENSGVVLGTGSDMETVRQILYVYDSAISGAYSISDVDMNEVRSKTVQEVKNTINAHFSEGADGQYLDIDGVFNELRKMAQEYEDDRITDLYYYDQNQGKFIWRESL